MGTPFIGRILGMQARIALKDPQVAALSALLKADDALSTEAGRLESARNELNSLLRQKSLDVKKVEQLHVQSTTLEKKLHEDASHLNDQLKGILDPTQLNAVEKLIRSADFQQSRPAVVIGPSVQFPPPPSNTWTGTWSIHGDIGNGLFQQCTLLGSWTPAGSGWVVLGGLLVPYCYKVDSSKGSSGGYTLDVIDSQGVQGTTVTPVIARSPANVYTIGFSVQVTICSQPFYGATAWYDATFTLYGIRICDNTI